MEFAEVVYVVIGAVLGFLASILTIVIERLMDRTGKLKVYYRITNSRGSLGGWGFEKEENGNVVFVVPVKFEIQNLSNSTRVIRDVSVLLYKGNEFVKKMVQVDSVHTTHREGKTVTGEEDFYYGAEKGSYSFVIPPRSIQPQECEYLLRIEKNKVLNGYFDNIRIRYFDEKDREKVFKVKDIDYKNLTISSINLDAEWTLLK